MGYINSIQQITLWRICYNIPAKIPGAKPKRSDAIAVSITITLKLFLTFIGVASSWFSNNVIITLK